VSEREGSGVARSAQHAVHVLPHAPHVIARFLGPALERVAPDADSTQLLVITPDADTALAVAEVARAISDRSPAPVVPITSAARGARLVGSRAMPALAATPSAVVSLLRSASLKLDAVRAVVVTWADEIVTAREDEALEVVFAELPKEASRVVVTDELTPEVEAFIERHLRRASRMGAAESAEPATDIPIRYVTTSITGRRGALRRLLDELDPPSAVVVANDAGGAGEARQAVAALGYVGEETVRVVTEPLAEPTALVVLYDLPTSATDFAQFAAAEVASVVALVTPRQVPALRRLTAGPVEPLDLSQAPAKARARDERLRSALRAELQAGFPAREIMALEPLLAEFDGLEVAAAALRLFERERAQTPPRRVETPRPAARASEERPAADRPERSSGPRGQAGFTRIVLSVGDRDGVRPGDLVGAITGETGITSDRIGKLDIRDTHTIAEVASSDAEAVIEKMNGVSMKGRRISARVDDRPAPRARDGGREGRGGPREGRSGPRAGGRGGFGERGGQRPRREGGEREGRFSREGRPARGFSRGREDAGERRPRRDDDRPRGRGGFRDRSDEGRVPRAAREREEWTDRAERVRNARRPRRDES
jgi:ATP-dependent RNA helicase DeaD